MAGACMHPEQLHIHSDQLRGSRRGRGPGACGVGLEDSLAQDCAATAGRGPGDAGGCGWREALEGSSPWPPLVGPLPGLTLLVPRPHSPFNLTSGHLRHVGGDTAASKQLREPTQSDSAPVMTNPLAMGPLPCPAVTPLALPHLTTAWSHRSQLALLLPPHICQNKAAQGH